MNPEKGSSTKGSTSGGTMIRMLGVQQTNEVKATQNLSIIVLFFMICWIPLYTINCILAFRPDFHVNSTFMLCCIILSHLNSAGNPLLYAYHLRDFRAALKNFFCNLFDHQQYCEQINRTNYNYSQYRLQLRKKSSTSSSYNLTPLKNCRVNLLTPDKISTIVKNSATVAAAATGELNRNIWNISEHSASSSDSLKSIDSCTQDKILMIRPATPYRPRKLSEINPAFMVTSCRDDESDDGFNEEETLPYHDYTLDNCELDTCLSDKTKKPRIVPPSYKKSLSTSSPQLSRGLFFVENDVNREKDKTVSFSLHESKRPIGISLSDDYSRKIGNFNLSPFRVVNNIFKNKKRAKSKSK
ncbi:hypothetical protein NQ314_007018 [Rhamnusium bicolor]|uniref:G-protein coupled receptors family 1 profile domain-containing protein n=1 Tax=Rhamnusium bicolor TaxID=1586634 RepID=A0AAV8YTK7_9CUCU|nr:hypothetical protein NQ314_007018 [Rhamnusium bicolor]